MTKSKDDKRQFQELLGMSQSAAERKLRKAIILELAQQLRKHVCLECGLEISDPDDLAVVHVEDWRDGPDFFDLANVAFSHASCRAGRHDRRQGEREMQRVDVTVEDSRGRPLRGCVHEGHVYVAGNKDQRYQVRVKNRTGSRLCLVVTVDGRNVNDGKKGSWDGSGFVLEAYQEWTFKGWRQSNDQVAAFRLGAKEDGYSSQKGTPQHTGVIGVAVFEEEQPERPVITVKETQYVPVPYPVEPIWPRPWPSPFWTTKRIVDNTGGFGQFDTGHRTGGVVPASQTYGTSDILGGEVQFSSTSDSSVGSSVEVNSSTSGRSGSVLSTQGLGRKEARRQREERAQNSGRRRKMTSRRGKSPEHEQELGTEYGESLRSKVTDTTFDRATDEPCELHLIRYDSLSALKKAGIMDGRRPRRKPETPRAFPESPEVERGFCEPPRRRRFR